MRIILVFLLIFSSQLLGSDKKESNSEKKVRTEQQLKKQMQKEKKYAKEQTFYNQDNYDFKSAEVNKDSLESLPDLEPQYDFDMDSVYD